MRMWSSSLASRNPPRRRRWRALWVRHQLPILAWGALRASGWCRWPNRTTNTSLKSCRQSTQRTESRYFAKSEYEWRPDIWSCTGCSAWRSTVSRLDHHFLLQKESKNPSFHLQNPFMQSMKRGKVTLRRSNLTLRPCRNPLETIFSKTSSMSSSSCMPIVSYACTVSCSCSSSAEDTSRLSSLHKSSKVILEFSSPRSLSKSWDRTKWIRKKLKGYKSTWSCRECTRKRWKW